MGNFLGKEKVSAAPRTHLRSEAQRRNIKIESGNTKFDFVEFQPQEASSVALVHFPAIGIDGEKDAEGIHYSMEQKYATLCLKDYGKEYSRDTLKVALEKAIRASGKKNVVLHGASFGAGVIYDLISDPSDPSFANKNSIRGAILETPALGKSHFNKRLRSVPDSILISSGRGISRAISISAPDVGIAGYRKSHQELNRNIFAELLREKTVGRKIQIPVHAVFAKGDHMLDNEKTLKTLQAQSLEFTYETVPSTARSLGHQIDYEKIYKQECAIIERFVGQAK